MESEADRPSTFNQTKTKPKPKPKQYDQSALLEEMVATGLEAVLVKVASQGLMPYKHLGKSIAELAPVFQVR